MVKTVSNKKKVVNTKKKVPINTKNLKKALLVTGLIAGIAGVSIANKKKIRKFYTDRAAEILNKVADRQVEKLVEKAFYFPFKQFNKAKNEFNNAIIEKTDNREKNELFKIEEYIKAEEALIAAGKLLEECSHKEKMSGGFKTCENQEEADKLIIKYVNNQLKQVQILQKEIDNYHDIPDDVFDKFLAECNGYVDIECTSKVNEKLPRKLTKRLLEEIAAQG